MRGLAVAATISAPSGGDRSVSTGSFEALVGFEGRTACFPHPFFCSFLALEYANPANRALPRLKSHDYSEGLKRYRRGKNRGKRPYAKSGEKLYRQHCSGIILRMWIAPGSGLAVLTSPVCPSSSSPLAGRAPTFLGVAGLFRWPIMGSCAGNTYFVLDRR